MAKRVKASMSALLALCCVLVFAAACSEKDAAPAEVEDADAQKNTVDVDLTALSSTMVYAEVFSMMSHPEEYMGKTIRINGPYYTSYYDETGLYYHYVIIVDATACCQNGLEFIRSGNYKYPEDYPEDSAIIEVTGIFESYDELGRTYYYLATDDMRVLR